MKILKIRGLKSETDIQIEHKSGTLRADKESSKKFPIQLHTASFENIQYIQTLKKLERGGILYAT